VMGFADSWIATFAAVGAFAWIVTWAVLVL
jgi:hypothetical protein